MLGFRVWGLGFRVQGLGFGVWGLGVKSSGRRVQGLGFRVEKEANPRTGEAHPEPLEFRDSGFLSSGSGVRGLGCRGFEPSKKLKPWV